MLLASSAWLMVCISRSRMQSEHRGPTPAIARPTQFNAVRCLALQACSSVSRAALTSRQLRGIHELLQRLNQGRPDERVPQALHEHAAQPCVTCMPHLLHQRTVHGSSCHSLLQCEERTPVHRMSLQ